MNELFFYEGSGEDSRSFYIQPSQRERENSNSNSKTLFHKDCSLDSFKNLSNN